MKDQEIAQAIAIYNKYVNGASSAPSTFDSTHQNRYSLQHTLESLVPLPSHSMLIGLCQDGLPLLLELTNPAPRSVLLTSDHSSVNAKMLNTFLSSAYALNSKSEVNLHLITTDEDELINVASSDICIQRLTPYDRGIYETISELTALAEQRRYGRQEGPVQILAITDLELLVSRFDYEDYLNFKWLLQHGAKSQVWTVATVTSQSSLEISKKYMQHLSTRIVSRQKNPSLTAHLTGLPRANTSRFIPGEQALVRSVNNQVEVWIPQTTGVVGIY